MEQEIQQSNSAKFAFYYMLSLVSLIFMAISTGIIIFQIINKKIVEVSTLPGGFDSGAMKFAISAMIISVPIYYILMWIINKSLYSGALKKESGVRKWLTYFILFVSAVVMIGWLIAVIFNFLDGELTTKFILKAIASIFISAAIFSYYFYDIKRDNVEGVKNKVVSAYFYVSLVLVIAALVSSFFFVESPTQTRNRKQDEAVLQKFDKIDSGINTYFQDNKKLPAKLDLLIGNKAGYFLTEDDVKDPVTGRAFDYKAVGKDNYEICAEFKSSNKNPIDSNNTYYKERWPHDFGYQCLVQKVRQDIKVEVPAPSRQ